VKALSDFDNSEKMRAASDAACRELLSMPFEDLVRLARAESSSDLAAFCAAGLEADAFGLGYAAKDVAETRLVSGIAQHACRISIKYITWTHVSVKSFGTWSAAETAAIANDDVFNSADYGMAAA
jgi:hypothetical protein